MSSSIGCKYTRHRSGRPKSTLDRVCLQTPLRPNRLEVRLHVRRTRLRRVQRLRLVQLQRSPQSVNNSMARNTGVVQCQLKASKRDGGPNLDPYDSFFRTRLRVCLHHPNGCHCHIGKTSLSLLQQHQPPLLLSLFLMLTLLLLHVISTCSGNRSRLEGMV